MSLTRRDKVLAFTKGCIFVGIVFFAVDAFADDVKTYGPKCYYEVTRVVENGNTVSETKVEVCEEETEQGKQKMDPVLKQKITDAALLVTLVAILHQFK